MALTTKPATFSVLSNRFERTVGQDAWRNNLRLTSLAANRVRSSFGPNGAYKMVTYNRGPEKVVKVTRDAVVVLEELAIKYPTLVVLSEAAKIQRQDLGDGVKSFIILTAELLKQADTLISKGVHPRRILKGYEEATKKALETITASSEILAASELNSMLDSADCGRGCLTSKVRQMLLDAKAIATVKGQMDRQRIRVLRKPGGDQSETQLFRGLIVKKGKLHPNMPKDVSEPRIAVTSERIGINRLEIKMPGQGPFHMKYKVSNPDKVWDYHVAEKQKKSDALVKLQALDVNVLLSQQPIDEFSKSELVNRGILAFSSVDLSDLTMICKATGACIVGNIAEIEKSDVGFAERVEMDKIGLEDIATFSCDGFATFIVTGATLQALDELELLINNSARLLQVTEENNRKVAGGGATEFHLGQELKAFALKFSGREQLAVESFAESLLEIQRCLATNCGLFAEDVVAQLGNLHAEGFSNYGLAADGTCGNACWDLAEVKKAYLKRAFEVVSLLLRIDEQIVAKEIPKVHKQ